MKGEAFYVTLLIVTIYSIVFQHQHIIYYSFFFLFLFFFFTDDTLGLGFEAMVQALLPGQSIMNLVILLGDVIEYKIHCKLSDFNFSVDVLFT